MRKLVSPSLRKLLTEQGTVPMLATRLFAMERHRTRRAALFAGTFLSAVVLGPVMQAHAEPTEFCDKVSEDCEPALRGGVLDNSVVGTEFVGENTRKTGSALRIFGSKRLIFRSALMVLMLSRRSMSRRGPLSGWLRLRAMSSSLAAGTILHGSLSEKCGSLMSMAILLLRSRCQGMARLSGARLR